MVDWFLGDFVPMVLFLGVLGFVGIKWYIRREEAREIERRASACEHPNPIPIDGRGLPAGIDWFYCEACGLRMTQDGRPLYWWTRGDQV